MSDDARILLVADLSGCRDRCRSLSGNPGRAATSTEIWFTLRSSSAILAEAALAPSVFTAHAPINSPARKLSVAKVASAAVGGSSGVSSAITRMPASRAFSMAGTMARESFGRDQDALGAGGDQIFDSGDLAIIVAVDLAGERAQFDAELPGRLGLGAGLHLDEKGIGIGLGDEADDRLVGGVGGGDTQGDPERGKEYEWLTHYFSLPSG